MYVYLCTPTCNVSLVICTKRKAKLMFHVAVMLFHYIHISFFKKKVKILTYLFVRAVFPHNISVTVMPLQPRKLA